ncbi:MAG: NADH-quinone oxidoreductase subunit L [Thermoplasmata archaeon]
MDPLIISGILIFLLPLIMFPIILLLGKINANYRKYAGPMATSAIFISFLLSYYLYINGKNIVFESQWFYNFTWGIYVDTLSISMSLMVSGVSFLIHMFAIGYMGKDPNKHVYFAETTLFTGGMLGVVLSSNMVMFFLFWELVGLCSYLLIGFWWFKPNAASAAKKAFIVTRVGDVLLILGLAVLYWQFIKFGDPLSVATIINNAHYVDKVQLAIAGALILGGAAGKSAQFPLHVWIPDAMEGPTTVSALIHAATMVTAGIYLVARIFPVYIFALPWAGYLVLYIGAFTAFLAGTMGIVMNDIKRILAYSTISQLGYMLAALGLGIVATENTISISIYHLIVHAFLKALLFLSAGAILYSLLDIRDIRKMGGLWKKMPITITAMFIGSLTLVGFPPTAGYFSKDEIISLSYFLSQNNPGIYYAWLLLLIGAFLTTVYTFRMFFTVALGSPRSYAAEHAKDPPWVMIVPLVILSILSLIYGIFQEDFYSYLGEVSFTVPIYVEMLPFILVLLGIYIAWLFYGSRRFSAESFAKRSGILYSLVRAKYYLDYIYTNIIADRVVVYLAYAFSLFDRYIVDGFVNAIGRAFNYTADITKRLQTGIVQNYATLVIIGLILFLIIGKIMGVI